MNSLTMSHHRHHHHHLSNNNKTIDRLSGDRPFQQQQQQQQQQQWHCQQQQRQQQPAFVTTSTALFSSSIRSSSSPSLASVTTTACRRRHHLSATCHTAPTAFITSSSPSSLRATSSRFTLRFKSHPVVQQRRHSAVVMEINVGDRVRVLDKGIMMYHFPGKQNEAVAVAGMTGEVIKDISVQKNVKVSTTAPYVVRLDGYPKLRTHFAESELEVLPPADDSSSSTS